MVSVLQHFLVWKIFLYQSLRYFKIFLLIDPPAPSKAPLVKAVSHSSLSVEFPDFESVNGPLKAYAVMITTEEQGKML